MIETLRKNWWLLALCGVLDAIISVLYFQHVDAGFRAWRDVVFLGRFTLAAGILTIAAGVSRSGKGNCWLLVLHGFALSALGVLFSGLAGNKISFRTVALLVMLMAVSIGILEVAAARALGWILRPAGAISVAFVVPFLAIAYWIKAQPGAYPDLFGWGLILVSPRCACLGWRCGCRDTGGIWWVRS